MFVNADSERTSRKQSRADKGPSCTTTKHSCNAAPTGVAIPKLGVQSRAHMSPLRIFLSSTFVDLEVHRAAVHSAIQKMEGHANDMIYWSADERAPEASSVERVTESDLVILIVAHR